MPIEGKSKFTVYNTTSETFLQNVVNGSDLVMVCARLAAG